MFEKKVAHTDGASVCHCATCEPVTPGAMRMVVCDVCGNKRCPHATNHIFACTHSNALGQPGSNYGVPYVRADSIPRTVRCECGDAYPTLSDEGRDIAEGKGCPNCQMTPAARSWRMQWRPVKTLTCKPEGDPFLVFIRRGGVWRVQDAFMWIDGTVRDAETSDELMGIKFWAPLQMPHESEAEQIEESE